jgi:hypothetical protein
VERLKRHPLRAIIAALLLLALICLAAGIAISRDEPDRAGKGASSASFDEGAAGREGAGQGADSSGPQTTPGAPVDGKVNGPGESVAGLKIIRSASLDLKVGKGRVDAALARVSADVSSLGGYVVSTTRGDGDGGYYGPAEDAVAAPDNSGIDRSLIYPYPQPRDGAWAQVTVRVPAKSFDSMISRASALGKVTASTISGEDVTWQYVDAKSRIRHAEAVEGRLLKLLERAQGVDEVLAIQDRLSQVQQQIEIDKGQLQQLDRMTEMSTVTVMLYEREASGKPREGFARAWADAREGFSQVFENALAASGTVMGILVLLGALGLVVAAAVGIRRRLR